MSQLLESFLGACPGAGFTGHSMGHHGAGRRSDLRHFGLCRFDGGQQPVYRRRRQCGFAAGGGSPDSGAGGGHRSGYGCGTADGAAAYAAWDSGHPVGNPVAAGSIFHQHAHSGALQPALAQGGDPSDAEKSCNGHYSGGIFALAMVAFLTWFFTTERGYAIRATGSNGGMARAQGINTAATTVLALMISNGLVGLAGGRSPSIRGMPTSIWGAAPSSSDLRP